MLVDHQIGSPMFDPTVFTLTTVQPRNLAGATIDRVLRAPMIFHLFCDEHRIDLLANMQDGRLLELSEIVALAGSCRLPLKEMRKVEARQPKPVRTKTSSLESFRGSAKTSKAIPYVIGQNAATRLRYIVQYIGWLADRRIQRLGASHPMRAPLLLAKEATVQGFIARIPTDKTHSNKRSSVHRRKALDEAAQVRLWQVTNIHSHENPWRGRHVRARTVVRRLRRSHVVTATPLDRRSPQLIEAA